VSNNPLRYTDPSGHKACGTKEECDELGITPSGRDLTYNQIMHKRKPPKIQSPEDLSTSDAGLEFIMKWEGFDGALYDDPGGNCTIGYGHLVHAGGCNGDASENGFTNGLSSDEAKSVLQEDVMVSEEAVRDLVKVKVTQSQFDALVSLVFNWGKGNLGKSPKIAMLNKELYYETGQHFNVGPITSGGVVQPGLVTRRYQESQMFLYGP
jgi:lysozyme